MIRVVCFFFPSAKSPYKLSTTEKRVIGGLKQLTELLFKQHYKPNANEQLGNDEPMQSNEVAMSMDYSTSSGANMYTNKENTDGNVHFDENLPDESDAMYHEAGEAFCGMVVQQLTTGDPNDHKEEEWHRGQLNAYNWAHEQLFEKK